jgi:hypothetical protein
MNYDRRTTHIDSSLKCLSVQAIHLGIYHNSNKPTNVESGLDKIWVIR